MLPTGTIAGGEAEPMVKVWPQQMSQNKISMQNRPVTVTGPGPEMVPVTLTPTRLSSFLRTWKPTAKSTSKWKGTNWIKASRLTKPMALIDPSWKPTSRRAPNCNVLVVSAK